MFSYDKVSDVVESLVRLAPPGLEVGGAADVLLHLLLPVQLGAIYIMTKKVGYYRALVQRFCDVFC